MDSIAEKTPNTSRFWPFFAAAAMEGIEPPGERPAVKIKKNNNKKKKARKSVNKKRKQGRRK
jgi:hypothetical protein